MLTGLIVVAVLAVFIYIGYARYKNSQVAKAQEEVVDRYKEATSEENVAAQIAEKENELLALNVKLRANVASPKVVEDMENLIDTVRAVLEPANLPENYSEQTVIVNRMSTNYIPEILDPYIALSENERSNGEAAFVKMIEELSTHMKEVKDSYDSQDKAAFEKNTRVMKALFETYNLKGEF